MIRFIRIGDQICDGDDAFAFWDTVTDRFVSVAGEVLFDDRDDLDDAIQEALRRGVIPWDYPDRLRGLIPVDYTRRRAVELGAAEWRPDPYRCGPPPKVYGRRKCRGCFYTWDDSAPGMHIPGPHLPVNKYGDAENGSTCNKSGLPGARAPKIEGGL